jgi:hypothetical protein
MLLANKSRDALNVPSRESIVSENIPFRYDYSTLKDRELEKWLKNCTKEIKSRNCKVILQLAQIGNLLIQAKNKLPGTYLEWLKAEFIDTGFFEKSTAENYIKVKKAVDEYGLEKLANFSMISIYRLFSNRIDKELRDFVVEELAPNLNNVTETVITSQKDKYNLLKKHNIPAEDKKLYLNPDVSLDLVNKIVALPEEERIEHVEKLRAKQVDTTVSVEVNDTNNHCLFYKTTTALTIETYDFIILQHALFREATSTQDLNNKIAELFNLTNNLAVLIDPLDLYSYKLEIPSKCKVKHIIFCRRKESRLLSDIDVNNILLAIVFITTRSNSRTLIDDYFLDIDKALISLMLGYSDNGEVDSTLLCHSNLEIEKDSSLYDPTFIDKLHSKVNNITVEVNNNNHN